MSYFEVDVRDFERIVDVVGNFSDGSEAENNKHIFGGSRRRFDQRKNS